MKEDGRRYNHRNFNPTIQSKQVEIVYVPEEEENPPGGPKTSEEVMVPMMTWLFEHNHGSPEPGATIKSIGLDSLDLIECIMFVEEKLNIMVEEKEIKFSHERTLTELAQDIATHII